MNALMWTVAVLALLAVAVLMAGQAGLLTGRAPSDLGVHAGRLKAPSTTPNSVSSQARLWTGHRRAEQAQIAPLALKGGDGPATLAALESLVRASPGAVIVSRSPDYLYAQFSTRLLKYTDDVEFWWDPEHGVIQVRSASRLGKSDLGLNRQRVERLRSQLAGG